MHDASRHSFSTGCVQRRLAGTGGAAAALLHSRPGEEQGSVGGEKEGEHRVAAKLVANFRMHLHCNCVCRIFSFLSSCLQSIVPRYLAQHSEPTTIWDLFLSPFLWLSPYHHHNCLCHCSCNHHHHRLAALTAPLPMDTALQLHDCCAAQ